MFLLWFFLDFSLKCLQCLPPELFEILAQGFEPLRIELIQAASPGGAIDDQMSLLENAKVLGNRGAADGKRAGEVSNGHFAGDEAGENGAAGGIAESIKLEVLVSDH